VCEYVYVCMCCELSKLNPELHTFICHMSAASLIPTHIYTSQTINPSVFVICVYTHVYLCVHTHTCAHVYVCVLCVCQPPYLYACYVYLYACYMCICMRVMCIYVRVICVSIFVSICVLSDTERSNS